MKHKTYLKLSIYLLACAFVFIACGDDDDNNVPEVIVRDRAEQQLADSDSISDYLKGHYYNAAFFNSGSNHSIDEIVITEMPTDDNGNYLEVPPNPDENQRLWDAVEEKTTVYEDTDYKYYILNLNQGSGESPKFTDEVRVRYEGFLVENDDIFDGVASPINILMQGVGFSGGVIRGWQLILPQFNTAANFELDNGVVAYNDYGLGMMFIPSGLAYFGNAVTGVPAYSNLVFKFELLQYQEVDHDGDGLPSFIEDLDSNSNVLDDDTDEDGIPNYFDLDDDGDGVNTNDELVAQTYTVDTNLGELEPVLNPNEYEVSRDESNGIITIETVRAIDINNNGILDYLDDTVTTNYNEDDE